MAFKIREYGRTELAQLYCPKISPESAWRKFKRWINLCPGLLEQLDALGYTERSRSFTPKMVLVIVECLGGPDD